MAIGAYNPPNLARHKIPKPTLLPQAIGHHTPAVRTLFSRAVGAVVKGVTGSRGRKKKAAAGATSTRRRRRKSSTTKSASTARSRSSRSKAHLVKGSKAAKTHMAKLRKMRKK